MTIQILGNTWEIIKKTYSEDETFKDRSYVAYCDQYNRQIIACDMTTYKNWEKEDKSTCEICYKENLRHEIVHAFFYESGLGDNSAYFEGAWAKNEEMVDWIAVQGEKIYKAWQEANAL